MIVFLTYIFVARYFPKTVLSHYISYLKPSSSWQAQSASKASLYIGLITFILGIIGFLAYGFEIGFVNLPLIVSFTQGAIEASIARSQFGAELTHLRWYQLFMNDLLLIGALIIFVCVQNMSIHKAARYFISASLLLFVGTISIIGGMKSNFVFILLAFYLAKRLHEDGLVSLRNLIIPGLLGLASLFIGYFLFIGVNSPLDAVRAIFSRTTTAQIETAYHHIDYIKQTGIFLMGQTFPNPKGIFPFEPISFTKELVVWVHGDNPHGIVGSYPSFFWAELYVNFSTIGVIIGSILVGTYLGVLDHLFKPKETSPIGIALFVWLILHFKDFALTSFSQFIFDTHFVIILLLFLIAQNLTRATKPEK